MTITLPALDFKIEGPFPLEINVDSSDAPELTLDWEFKFAFGYDEDDG